MKANFIKSAVLPLFAAVSLLACISCEKDPKNEDPAGGPDDPGVPADEELVLSETSVNIQEKGTYIVGIASGNGEYEVESADEAVAKATVNETNIVISAVAAGSTVINVTDAKEKTATINVKVTPQAKGVDMGIGYGGGNQGTHAVVRVPIKRKYYEAFDFTHMEAVTMECLVKFTSPFLTWADNSTSNWLNSIMGAGDNFWIRLNAANEVGVEDGSTLRVNAVVPGGIELNTRFIEAGKWYHVALTFKAGTVKLYLNGELAEEGTTNQDFVDLTIVNNLGLDGKDWEGKEDGVLYPYDDFFLGQWNQSRFLNGCMSEARLWSVARSDEQIAANATYLDVEDEIESYGLLGYWKLSGDAAAALKDYGPYHFDAELVGEISFAATDVPVDYSR